MVTAELATGLPVLLFLLFVALAAIDLAHARIRCSDVAASIARQVARGGPVPPLEDGRLQVRIVRTSATVTVTVSTSAVSAPVLSRVVVSDTVVAALEPVATGMSGTPATFGIPATFGTRATSGSGP